MTEQACRFEKSVLPVAGIDVCVAHKSHAVLICDLGLAALRRQLDDQARVMGRMREALQPFAALLHPHHKSQEGTYPVFGINEEKITVADLRRAKKALSPEPKEE